MIRDIFYDTEFLDWEDDQKTELISIALADLDGNKYYGIVKDDDLIDRAFQHSWLPDNVLKYLPITWDRRGEGPCDCGTCTWDWDESHPDFVHVKSRAQIAADVFSFIRNNGVGKPRLWAYFSAYDHFCLSKLWGAMIDSPYGVPHHTNCLRQHWEMVGRPERPPQPLHAHDPRADVEWDIEMFRVCQKAWLELVTP